MFLDFLRWREVFFFDMIGNCKMTLEQYPFSWFIWKSVFIYYLYYLCIYLIHLALDVKNSENVVKSGYGCFEKSSLWRAPFSFQNEGEIERFWCKNIITLRTYWGVGIYLKYCSSTLKASKNVVKSGFF